MLMGSILGMQRPLTPEVITSSQMDFPRFPKRFHQTQRELVLLHPGEGEVGQRLGWRDHRILSAGNAVFFTEHGNSFKRGIHAQCGVTEKTLVVNASFIGFIADEKRLEELFGAAE